jgi:hypothetical protein
MDASYCSLVLKEYDLPDGPLYEPRTTITSDASPDTNLVVQLPTEIDVTKRNFTWHQDFWADPSGGAAEEA